MKNLNKYYHWFKKLGGDTTKMDVSQIHEILNEPIFLISTFKTRAEEIKNKYNYKFKTV